MIIHPEFDPTTKTWFVSIRGTNYEAPSISKLINKTPPGIRRTLVVQDYYPVGKRMPPIDYGPSNVADFMKRPNHEALHAAGRGGAITLGKGALSKDRTEPRFMGGAESNAQTVSKEVMPPDPNTNIRSDTRPTSATWAKRERVYKEHPELAAGRSTKGMLPAEREKLNDQILDMWAAGKTSAQIAEELNLKINYIGCNVLPTARVRGDKRAEHRTDQKYISNK
mgnify:CR=1 FL=1